MNTDFRGFCELQQKKNDSRIDWAFKDMMDKLGFALTTVYNVIAPSVFVIGGQAAFLPDRYLARLAKNLAASNAPSSVIKESFGDERFLRFPIISILKKINDGNIVL